MKIRLDVDPSQIEEITHFLTEHGIEIDEESEFVLSQRELVFGKLCVKDALSDEKVYIDINDILYIESFGHQIDVATEQGIFSATSRLYQLEEMLGDEKFLRISKSVIIAKKKVKEIRPSFSMKFVLIMSNNTKLEVTRSYYNSFRDAFGI